ncbi:hypothetical protein Pcinc_013053 [Petrolisthes cinctipes]|uniref:Uncharacterized protein n=1 Tax=Petrolisthes cinctipes TaxID=88211 RepID=A0AAE1FZA7_PETCI|nr:hypothetical protein Pcinc_013053 [Petrolisthes cinctipes]
MIILQILKIVVSLCCRSVESVLESVTDCKVGEYNAFAMTLKWILLIVCVLMYLYKQREKTRHDAEAVRERTQRNEDVVRERTQRNEDVVRERTQSIMDRLEGLERTTATILTRLEQLQDAINTTSHREEGNVQE